MIMKFMGKGMGREGCHESCFFFPSGGFCNWNGLLEPALVSPVPAANGPERGPDPADMLAPVPLLAKPTARGKELVHTRGTSMLIMKVPGRASDIAGATVCAG